jgi:putative transposase
MFVAERFLSKGVDEYGQHTVSTKDGGTWYLQACKFLKIDHHIHFLYIGLRKVSLKEQCSIKDRTESFDDYFPCKKKKCNISY